MLETVETPALILDLDQVKENLKDIAEFAKAHGVNYRPHVKTHKSVALAKLQQEYGAVGITVATVGEAEVMVDGGIEDILLAYPLATKLDRIQALLKRARLTLAVDSLEQVRILADYFEDQENRPQVWIKVDSGLRRCGLVAEEVGDLAAYIQEETSLSLTGIFTHAGHSYAAANEKALEKIALDEAAAVLKAVRQCEARGISIKHRSIGSTPTFKIGGKLAGITEIRPGNAIFYDMVQVGLGVARVEQCALTVLATVGSVHGDRIVIDTGSKSLNLDRGAHGNESIQGYGHIKEYPELVIERLSEEHGVIPIREKTDIKITDRLTIIPNHACTVANLFDAYYIVESGQLLDRWPVDARGRVD